MSSYVYFCEKCEKILDMDVNAAINILNYWFNGMAQKIFSKLRPHMLRKFHSTHLNQESLSDKKLGMDEVDPLHVVEKTRQGKAISRTILSF